MADSVVEKIAVALAAVVDAVDGLTALRPKRVFFLDEVTQDSTVVIMQEKPEKLGGTLHTQDWRQPFTLTAIVVDSDTATASIDTRLNAIRAAVETALLAEPTLGGLVIDLQIEAPDYKGTDTLSCIEIRCTVDYRTQYANPYTQA